MLETPSPHPPEMQTGVASRLSRGVGRLFAGLGHAVLFEARLGNNRRADVLGLARDGRIVIADEFGAVVQREAPNLTLAPARRRALTLHLARQAAAKLHRLADPDAQERESSF